MEIAQQLQSVNQDLEALINNYGSEYLQTLSEKLVVIRGQLNHSPKPRETLRINGRQDGKNRLRNLKRLQPSATTRIRINPAGID
ncbi:MAG: hypothetical protein INR62_02690 [Rhodospirillales bacterium]|nr:hypothetical protein [Acetobacter sp.]